MHQKPGSHQFIGQTPVAPSCEESFVLDTHPGGRLILEQAQSSPAKDLEAGIGVSHPDTANILVNAHVQVPVLALDAPVLFVLPRFRETSANRAAKNLFRTW